MTSSHCDTIDELPEEEERESRKGDDDDDDDRIKPPPVPARRTIFKDKEKSKAEAETKNIDKDTESPSKKASEETESKRSPLMKVRRIISAFSTSSSRKSSTSSSLDGGETPTIVSMSPKNNPSAPDVIMRTWKERHNKVEDEELQTSADSGASFSRASSLRQGFRGSSGRRRAATATITSPTSSTSSSAFSSPSLMTASSRNHPQPVDEFPEDLKPEDLRLNLELLQRDDSTRSSRTSADFRSLEPDFVTRL